MIIKWEFLVLFLMATTICYHATLYGRRCRISFHNPQPVNEDFLGLCTVGTPHDKKYNFFYVQQKVFELPGDGIKECACTATEKECMPGIEGYTKTPASDVVTVMTDMCEGRNKDKFTWLKTNMTLIFSSCLKEISQGTEWGGTCASSYIDGDGKTKKCEDGKFTAETGCTHTLFDCCQAAKSFKDGIFRGCNKIITAHQELYKVTLLFNKLPEIFKIPSEA